MASRWADRLPVQRVPLRDIPQPLTCVYPFYDNDAFLRTQIAHWRAYPDDLRAGLTVIVVDDGSRGPGAAPAFANWDGAFSVRVFKIEQDVRWNWLAARNIGAHHASDGWLLLTDMDHVVPANTMETLRYGVFDPSTIYVFGRQEHTGEPIAPHSASFLMTKQLFWRIGGYDERCSGRYGYDGVWRRRCAAVAPFVRVPDVLIRYENQGDSSTTTYQRKQPIDAELPSILATFPLGSTPTHLTFPYHEVSV